MATPTIGLGIAQGAHKSYSKSSLVLSVHKCVWCQKGRLFSRRFVTSARLGKDGGNHDEGPFKSRLHAAWRKTKIDWKPIPVGLGVAFLGAVQFYRVREREKRRRKEEEEDIPNRLKDDDDISRPKKRKRIRPSGPWYASILGLIRLGTR